MPRISLGLPVYNGENFICQAIDSILAQTYRDFELIICDNGSTDRTREICESYAVRDSRIRFSRSDVNRGATWNQNRVFELSQGEFFKWCAHDDMLAPEMLRRCIEALEQNPLASLAFTIMRFIDKDGAVIGVFKPDTQGYDSPLPHVRFGARTSRVRAPFPFCRKRCDDVVPAIFGLIRSSALRQTPLLGAYAAADHILVARLALLGPFVRVPEPLFLNRRHATQSVEAYRRMQDQVGWWDPNKESQFSFPDWRLVEEYVRSVGLYRQMLTPYQQFRCYLKVGSYLLWNWPRLARDLVLASAFAGRRFRSRLRSRHAAAPLGAGS
jgi:glycosyltransferase involved in cell wall biosynthesis